MSTSRPTHEHSRGTIGYYMESRLVTVNDQYAFDPEAP